MKAKKHVIMMAIVMSLTACFTFAAGAADEPIKWVFQSWQNYYHKPIVELADEIRKATNGRVRIEVAKVGTYAPTKKMLEAVRLGIVDGINLPAVLGDIEKHPALVPLCTLPAAYTSPEQRLNWYYEGGGMEIAKEVYASIGVVFIGVLQSSVESMVSRKPLRGLSDLKGMSMRLPPGMHPIYFKKLGVESVALAPEDIKNGLETGFIDALDLGPIAQNLDAGFYKVKGAQHTNYPGFHSMPSFDITVNKKKWDGVSSELKDIIHRTVKDWSYDLIERYEADNKQALEKVKAMGVNVYKFNPEDVKKARKLAVEVWDQWAQKSPMAKKAIESQKAWLKKLELLE